MNFWNDWRATKAPDTQFVASWLRKYDEAKIESPDPSGKGAEPFIECEQRPDLGSGMESWLIRCRHTGIQIVHGPREKADAYIAVLQTVLDDFASSLRQQLDYWKKIADENIGIVTPVVVDLMLRQKLSEALGKVSQLEADNAKLRASNKYCSETLIGDMLESAVGTMEANQRAAFAESQVGTFCEMHLDTTLADANVNDPCPLCALTSQVSVLTKERDDSREGHRITGDCLKESITRYELAESRLLEWENKEASVCPEDVGFVEFIGVLQKRLSAVSEVVRTLPYSDVGNGEAGARGAEVFRRRVLLALTNYEKAKQKEGVKE